MHNHPRPYWHVDAKWICALLLSVVLSAWLLVFGLFRLTQRGTAVELTARVTASLFSRTGLDDPADIQVIKEQMISRGQTESHPLSPDITITLHDLESLSPRDVRLKIFRQLAAKMYDLGPQGIKQVTLSQGGDQQQADKAAQDAFAFSFFTAKSHAQLAPWLIGLGAACLVLLVGLVFFASGAGRLVSPSLVLLYVSWPALLLSAVGTAQTHNQGGSPDIGSIAGYVTPLVVGALIPGYIAATITAAGLLLAAIVTKGFIKRKQTHEAYNKHD